MFDEHNLEDLTGKQISPQEFRRLLGPPTLTLDTVPHEFDLIDTVLAWVRDRWDPRKPLPSTQNPYGGNVSYDGGVFFVIGGIGEGKTASLRFAAHEISRQRELDQRQKGRSDFPIVSYFDFRTLPVKKTVPEWVQFNGVDSSFARALSNSKDVVLFFDHIERTYGLLTPHELCEWENYVRGYFKITNPHRSHTKVLIACRDDYYSLRVKKGVPIFGVKPCRVCIMAGIDQKHPDYQRVMEERERYKNETIKKEDFWGVSGGLEGIEFSAY